MTIKSVLCVMMFVAGMYVSMMSWVPMSIDEGNTNSYWRLVRIRVDDELSSCS